MWLLILGLVPINDSSIWAEYSWQLISALVLIIAFGKNIWQLILGLVPINYCSLEILGRIFVAIDIYYDYRRIVRLIRRSLLRLIEPHVVADGNSRKGEKGAKTRLRLDFSGEVSSRFTVVHWPAVKAKTWQQQRS